MKINNRIYSWITSALLLCSGFLQAQEIAVLKYNGGGDWYVNPTSLPNLIKFCNQNITTTIKETPQTVEPSSVELFQYPFVHMTGHGNVFFTSEDVTNLRNYLLSGGFLHIDDNYGLDKYVRPELNKLFPEKELIELNATHPIFNYHYKFPNGLPKIHEHDNKPPQAFGIFEGERLILLYTYESDLGNGWENKEIHNDPEEVRLKALQMGANIIKYVFEN
ncbi:MAG: hypothetical protein COZ75_11785 [Flavobacteriaceae bacterium CG_4_8_14_3_um_filter_34_10]|nr:DUF4159 domain-containing protein [Flavobacteriia bacterium]OIP49328.1 MAG: hypothetical protein AUK33_10820 [Flavobacteriaceae bacterium CG2_30_34_30]PIV50252.1 MAG: hypothetical protein COS19_04575 [Flavobacteriaceae bacterium CG02_land_8_20_14_3_00_34_13]PIX08496.1 MAG: hypothetical protein COZ75_11785 [Flavobacteriaceae bacterium CG_4_8_14_3_um_filter_34_10]